jgi:hypothetical protein
MMQVSNKVFRHNFLEKGDRLLFWNIIRRFPILLVSGKERATVPSLKKVACPLFSPFFPCFTPCLQVTRFDKNQRMT